MKKIAALIAMLACAACVSSGGGKNWSGSAANRASELMDLHIPEGWMVDYATPGTVTMMAEQGVMSVSLEDMRGMEPLALANTLAVVMQGTAPLEDEGVYLFTIKNREREGLRGEDMPVLVRADGDRAVLLFLYDPEDQLMPQARKVLDSVHIKR